MSKSMPSSVQLAVGARKEYTNFCIHVRVAAGYSWVVERRYTQFYVLHKLLKKRFPDEIGKLRFPAKKMFFSLASSTVEERRKTFQEYLRFLLQLRPRPMDLNSFLEVSEHASLPRDELEAGSARAAAEAGALGVSLDGKDDLVAAAMAKQAGQKDGKDGAEGLLAVEDAGKVSIEDFELLKTLGKGSFGRVFLVRRVQKKVLSERRTGSNHNLYAMKVLKKSEVKRRRQVEHTKTERHIMGTIGQSHPFIVTLQYAFQTKDKLYMVTNYCRGGELFFHLKKMRRFTEEMCRFYSAEIILALEHLHKNDIVYRDLKPENVLLEEDGNIRITDFGLSRENVDTPTGATTFCGTPEYLSPEMILHRQVGPCLGLGRRVEGGSEKLGRRSSLRTD